ncbi:hypothetical protein BC829DRAFT_416106 [Chytridium lagenaria]|nr:hypothetical protein BC829DRAFT_416106 [Chytridium lagenaria]
MYCPCCDEEVESITTARHLEDHLRSTSANGHAMRGPIITMMMRLDSSASVYQGLASILGGSHATIQQPQRSTATEKRGAKGHYHLQTVTATRNILGVTTRLYRLTEAEKKAMDVLLTEKVRIAALMDSLPKLGFDPAVAESLRLKIAKAKNAYISAFQDTWSPESPRVAGYLIDEDNHVIIEWADKESEVVAVPDEPRKQEPLPRKKPAPYEKVRFTGKPAEEEESDVEESTSRYEPTVVSYVKEHEIEVVKPKQERSVKAAKVPPKLSIDVAKSKKAHVEEEMEITEEPLPTAGKGKGSITSPSSKGKEKGTTSTSSKTKKPAPEEEEAAKPNEEEEEAVPAAKPIANNPIAQVSKGAKTSCYVA